MEGVPCRLRAARNVAARASTSTYVYTCVRVCCARAYRDAQKYRYPTRSCRAQKRRRRKYSLSGLGASIFRRYRCAPLARLVFARGRAPRHRNPASALESARARAYARGLSRVARRACLRTAAAYYGRYTHTRWLLCVLSELMRADERAFELRKFGAELKSIARRVRERVDGYRHGVYARLN